MWLEHLLFGVDRTFSPVLALVLVLLYDIRRRQPRETDQFIEIMREITR